MGQMIARSASIVHVSGLKEAERFVQSPYRLVTVAVSFDMLVSMRDGLAGRA